jgi:hypothetical protein
VKFGKLDNPMRAAAARETLLRVGPPKVNRHRLKALEDKEDYEACARIMLLASIRSEIGLVSAACADPVRLSALSMDT